MCFDDKIHLGMMPNRFKNTPKIFRLRRAALRPGGPRNGRNPPASPKITNFERKKRRRRPSVVGGAKGKKYWLWWKIIGKNGQLLLQAP